MAKIEPIAPYLEPVRKSVTINRTLDEAFRLFTAEITAWWPKDRYSVSQERTREVVLEPRVGGAIYEVRDDGQTFPWGRVDVWEPPGRLVMSWHPGREAEVAQEVEVRFTAVAEGTRVDLEHRNWTRLGEEAGVVRDRYRNGWTEVLGTHFVAACAANLD
jgi:hypothetical protein